MSATGPEKRITPPDIQARKGADPLVVLTAYTTPVARLVDPHCDIVLVGDSVAMVLHGHPTTLQATMEMMVLHGQSVARGLSQAMMVIDMPFGSYEEGRDQAFRNAARLIAETGAAAVKLEGGEAMAETIGFLSRRGIPVMAHVGLTPQAVNALGGYGARGKSKAEEEKILADGRAVQQAGAFAVVVEGVLEPIAIALTEALAIPTIGIGGSARCDGQVLVTDDMLGMFERVPRFVKRYAEVSELISQTAARYAEEVRARTFPGVEQTYQPK